MDASKITTGARLHGAVMHVITTGAAFSVSACGRVVTPGTGAGKRVCRTCIRVSPDAFRLDASKRKAEREARMRRDVAAMESVEPKQLSWDFLLDSLELAATQEKIAAINARCEKRGIPGGLRVEFTEEIQKETNALGFEIEHTVYRTVITGVAPSLPDWEFMATLDYDANAGLIIRAYPGMPAVDRTALREGWCDHCHTNRYRRTTYVMRHKVSGEEIQVGSSCIKDFTGWTALPVTFDYLQKEIEGFSGGFGGAPKEISVLTALAFAWAAVTEWGYVRASEPGATKGVVMDMIDPPRPTKHNGQYLADLASLRKHSEEMGERAKELRAFILNDVDFPLSTRSDYAANVKAIARPEMVSLRQIGILASAPQAWARFQEKSFIAEKAKAPESNWVGEIGERWEMSLTFKAVRYIESMYGRTALHTFVDDSGNVFKWFASTADFGGYEGDRFHITAGIKAHKDFKGAKETHLTRVKEIDAEKAESKCIKPAPIKAKDEMRVDALTVDINGVYMINGEYFKIRRLKETAYAVKHTADGWVYSPQSVKGIRATDALTADEAARFGKTHAHCVYCYRPLTDERSLHVGYGPDCAERVGLPWGE